MSSIQVEKLLHMNGEEGDCSYANNSAHQKMVILRAKPLIQESIVDLCCKYLPECFQFADLGCSSAASAYMPALQVIEVLDSTCQRLNHKPPMLQVFLNDLPGNDFNSTFKLLPSFYERVKNQRGSGFAQYCFIAAVPGSFYGRLFPPHSLHFIFSSYSLHWLSQVPQVLVSESGISLNKENVYPTKTSSPSAHRAYLGQFESDFTTFLKCRSEELKPEGRLVLTLMGNDNHHPNLWELLGIVIHDMVSEGVIEESKLESFNFPFYSPSAEEVTQIIQREGSFNIHQLETFNSSWLVGYESDNKGLELDKYARGKHAANIPRAVAESLLANHFGNAIIDEMFRRLSIKIIEYMEMGLGAFTNLLISMIKK